MSLRVLPFKAMHLILINLFSFIEYFIYTCENLVSWCLPKAHFDDYDYISKEAQKLPKRPTHLTILLGEKLPPYEYLANLVKWSIASGIHYVSFYDRKGIPKETLFELQKVVESKRPERVGIIWCDGLHPPSTEHEGKAIQIKTLSCLDNRPYVTDVTKLLSSNATTEIDEATVAQSLKTGYEFPDPEMGLCCGSCISLDGYPSWQIKLTELFCLGSHYNVKPYTFLKALQKYSTTEQRFGK